LTDNCERPIMGTEWRLLELEKIALHLAVTWSC
jgi:hypothetical protein